MISRTVKSSTNFSLGAQAETKSLTITQTKLVPVLYLGEYPYSETVKMTYGHLCALFVFGLVGMQLPTSVKQRVC